MGERELVIYEFSRTKIERGDFSHFLGAYGYYKLDHFLLKTLPALRFASCFLAFMAFACQLAAELLKK